MLSPALAAAHARGAARVLPLHYREIPRWLRDAPVDAAIAHVATPQRFALSSDLAPAAFAHARLRVLLVNAAMPDIPDAPAIALDDVDIIARCDVPLAEAAPAPADAVGAIARTVADLVEDGDVIQIGVGRLPGAIAAALGTKRHLKVHSGLLSAAHIALLDAGAIADAPGALTAGAILADAHATRRLAADPRVRLRPVEFTHDQSVLGAIARFTSINAALEVDLMGQVNAEFVGDRQIAGVGGMADFVRGAAAAPGGRAIIALAAAGKDGTSRIVPRLASPAVTLSRADAPIIVTEYGSADLRRLDAVARAEALIAIAAPAARASLRAHLNG